jgi:hypothetical protein
MRAETSYSETGDQRLETGRKYLRTVDYVRQKARKEPIRCEEEVASLANSLSSDRSRADSRTTLVHGAQISFDGARIHAVPYG